MRPRTLIVSTLLHTGAVLGIGLWVGAFAGPGRLPTPTIALALDEPVEVVVVERRDEPLDLQFEEPAVQPVEPWMPMPEFVPDERLEEVTPVETEPPWTEPRARVFAREPELEVVEAAAEPVVESFVEALYHDDRNKPPVYPRLSKLRNETGVVVLLLTIDVTGQVTEVELEQGCGHPRLHRAAIVAARDWVFAPARENGTPVVSRKRHTVEFRIES